jgi:GH15 family glucan-1,4-alpha-glucosidase
MRPHPAESWSEERQAFAESFGGRDLDASALLMAEVNMIDPNDPRFIATVDALEKSLCDGPYMRRYEAPTISASPRPPSTSAPSGASTRWPASAARRRPARSSR